MIKVRIVTTNGAISDIVDENTTVRQVLEEKGVNYSRGINQIDGCPVQIGQLDRTFAQLGITERCNIVSIVKTDNA